MYDYPSCDPKVNRFFWLRGARAPLRNSARLPLLRRPLVPRYDVAIIGGGLTGCSAALHLAEGGRRVALLEAGRLASGASSRNTGMLVSGYALAPKQLLERFGDDLARRAWQLSLESINLVERLARRLHLDCDLERPGALYCTWDAEDMDELADELEARRRLGASCELLSRQALQERIEAPRLHGALYLPDDGLINPIAFTHGLATAAETAGAHLCEGVRVIDIAEDGTGGASGCVRLRCLADGGQKGELSAGQVVLATNAYLNLANGLDDRLRGWLRQRVHPIRGYVMTTEPLSAGQRQAIGWQGRELLWDTRHNFSYLRLSADQRVMIGGGRVSQASDDDPPEDAAQLKSFLHARLCDYFPALADLQPATAWEGSFAITADLLPYIGPLAGRPRLYLALGFNGHGLAQATLAGKLVARSITHGEDTTSFNLFNPDRSLPDEQPLIMRRLVKPSISTEN